MPTNTTHTLVINNWIFAGFEKFRLFVEIAAAIFILLGSLNFLLRLRVRPTEGIAAKTASG